MILDTGFIIDVMRREENAVRRLRELISSGETQAITTPSLFELYSGVSRSRIPQKEKGRIMQTLSNLVVWSLDTKGAETGGEIDGRLSSKGERLDPVDSMIAGIALSKGEAILTRNVRHFSRIPGLRIETY